jgi:hypothetical protein
LAVEQVEGAEDVGLDEGGGAVDGAVDVALGREVDDGVDLVLAQQLGDRSRSPMSPWTKTCRGWSATDARVSRLPA